MSVDHIKPQNNNLIYDYQIDGKAFKNVCVAKDLGVILSSTLNPQDHITARNLYI